MLYPEDQHMTTQQLPAEQSRVRSIGDAITENATVMYPLLVGLVLIGVGPLLDALGRGVEAGVTAATGIIVCALTVVVYVALWLVGRFGH